MRVLKAVGATVAVLLVAALAFILLQAHRRPPLAPYASLQLPAVNAAGTVRVSFAGVSTLMFDDGETAFVTDGFFPRPSLSRTLFTRIATDERRVDAGLAQLGARRLAAVVVLHGHYDHAMDAPTVARKTGALLVGDESVMHVGRGAGLAPNVLRQVAAGDAIRLGQWRLTFIPSRHAPTPFSDGAVGERIDHALAQPARATAWREGEVWSLLVQHRSGRSYLVQGSAGYVEGALRGRKADVVFLGVGAAGKQSEDYRARFWSEVPRAVGARVVIPIHWDDFWQGLDEPLRAMPLLFDDFSATMAQLQRMAAADGVALRLPPPFVPFDPYADRGAPTLQITSPTSSATSSDLPSGAIVTPTGRP